MEKPCPFCSPSSEEIVTSNDLCYARYDKYPVSPGHVLIIPFRHVAGFFDLTGQEQDAAWELVFQRKERLVRSVGWTGSMWGSMLEHAQARQ